MSLLLRLKHAAEAIPEPLGQFAARVPFSWRLGRRYATHARRIAWFASCDNETQRAWVFDRVRRIVHQAAETNRFYRDFYRKHGFRAEQLRRFDDIQRIPVVTKADLQEYALDDRSASQRGRLRVNTGGTSGQPLEFYLDRGSFAKEWAHMHRIWSRLNYAQTDRKLTFRGKDLGGRIVRYNAVHNEHLVNAYVEPSVLTAAVDRVIRTEHIRFLHGYPSAIYDFATYCDEHCQGLSARLRQTLAGVLLGSEFPAPVYRERIEAKFKVPTLSWYGHSEMAVLAEERERYVYFPMHTYGYCEAVENGDGLFRLVGTSYDNTASPFIRYDTGDFVTPEDEQAPLRAFRIHTGRVGEYVVDAHGHRISLTALVFGRHHALFRVARFVQVQQDRPGEVDVHVTLPPERNISADALGTLFDTGNVALEFRFQARSEPFRTPAGKVPLLVAGVRGPDEVWGSLRAA
jgi:phenylacetate-CoA ligase